MVDIFFGVIRQHLNHSLLSKGLKMCSRTTCRKCGKPTWSGCGNHVEIALKGVAKKDRCQGHANDPKEPGFMSRLFGGKK
jgi:hypothetical protein